MKLRWTVRWRGVCYLKQGGHERTVVRWHWADRPEWGELLTCAGNWEKSLSGRGPCECAKAGGGILLQLEQRGEGEGRSRGQRSCSSSQATIKTFWFTLISWLLPPTFSIHPKSRWPWTASSEVLSQREHQGEGAEFARLCVSLPAGFSFLLVPSQSISSPLWKHTLSNS